MIVFSRQIVTITQTHNFEKLDGTIIRVRSMKCTLGWNDFQLFFSNHLGQKAKVAYPCQ